MITFRPLNGKTDWEWVKTRAHILLVEDTTGLVAERDGKIQAVAVFDSFTVNACNVHMAIENPMVIKYGFLHEIGHYLFNVRDRKRIFGLVPSNNAKAMRLDKHIGMSEIARVPNALAEGIDYVVLEMTREECRWIEPVKEAANGY